MVKKVDSKNRQVAKEIMKVFMANGGRNIK